MRLGRLTAQALIRILNNFLHAWHLIGVFQGYFSSVLRNIFHPTFITMDGEGADQRDHHDLPMEPQQQQQQPVEAMEHDIAEVDVVMGLGYDDDNDDDDVDIENVEEEEDDGDDDDDDDDDESDISSEGESDYLVEMESDYELPSDEGVSYRGDYSANSDSEMDMGNNPFHRRQNITLYTFKPQRLIKCNYKKLHCPLRYYPFARSGHRVVATESDLYLLGGYNPRSSGEATQNRGKLFQELWRYNFGTQLWVQLHNATVSRNMPRELASNALIISNNLLISYGGTGHPFGEACSNQCYIYQTQGDNPSILRIEATGDAPTPQYGPGIVLHKNFLYTIGGTTGFDYSCDVHRLNLRTRVWECVYVCRTDIRDDPQGRYRHEVVYDGNYIYVLGGGTSHSVYDLKSIPAYNIKANRWDYIDTLPDPSFERNVITAREPNYGYPEARKCFSCVQHKNSYGEIEAFISGGLQSEEVYFSDIWRINFATKQWTLIKTASLPKALYFHAAADNQQGCMYIFGGIEYDKKHTRRCNDLYKMWMTIPKLSEICWEAVLHYEPNLKIYGQTQLLKMGIPIRFAQRLGFHSTRAK